MLYEVITGAPNLARPAPGNPNRLSRNGSQPPSRRVSDELLEGLRGGDADAFDAIFRTHYGRLAGLAETMLGDRAAAEKKAKEILAMFPGRFSGGRQSHPAYSLSYANRRRLA